MLLHYLYFTPGTHELNIRGPTAVESSRQCTPVYPFLAPLKSYQPIPDAACGVQRVSPRHTISRLQSDIITLEQISILFRMVIHIKQHQVIWTRCCSRLFHPPFLAIQDQEQSMTSPATHRSLRVLAPFPPDDPQRSTGPVPKRTKRSNACTACKARKSKVRALILEPVRCDGTPDDLR